MLQQIDNYILEKKIGSGNYGEVFRGFDLKKKQTVAIKVIKKDLLTGQFLDLFTCEVKILKSVQSPNIIKLFDVKKTKKNVYMIFEYCEEGDLSEYLKNKGFLKEEEAVRYFLEILNGFKVLVKNNILHRDFKLANVLKHKGTIKICDFGFSKLLNKWNMTQTVLGSPINMAPEIIEGSPYNNKADIWSLGIAFYELLFGRPPFLGLNIVDLLNEIKTKVLEFPRDVNNISNETEDILRRMLEVDPRERIEWQDLFHHKITNQPKERIKKHIQTTFEYYNFRRMFNMGSCYFYLNMHSSQNPVNISQSQVLSHSILIHPKNRPAIDNEDTASTQGTEKVFSTGSKSSCSKF